MSTATPALSTSLIGELQMEADATKKLLDAVPADKLTWKPHQKSMTLGQLAYHVASIPGDISGFLEMAGLDASTVDFKATQPASASEIQEKFASSVETARQKLEALTDDRAAETWRLTMGEEEIWSLPKSALARALMFNHLYHHRGQLTVYLRLLDIPVPVVYGRTADVNPFG